ncbi:MAG TPA: GNAT family N-acetyltransferase [Lacipirellulaceae bacterium]|jgi:CelD/BcsL family acetyltransferase involved in cellulose biosynthesis|nr:GNAT family N-acetyltransferase [Lacipirellulaceae bacterium]
MVEVVEINDVEELTHYRLVWNSLFPGTSGASFFQTFDWFETYWRHFGHDQKMRVLIVYGADEPIGIVPLCVRREAYRVGNVRVLTYPLDNWSAWYGPIGPNPATTMMAAMQHIRRTPRDWDMIELRWVADEGVQGGKTARAMRIVDMFSEKREYESTSLIDLPATWDEYVAGKSHTSRRHFRHAVRDLFEQGRAEYIRHRPAAASEGDGDPRWDLYAACESVAQASWQSHVVHGNTLTHDRVREYFHAAHVAAARVGMVDVNVLNIDGQPTAFLYGYHCHGTVTTLRTGFNATTASGAGTTLLLKTVQDSCTRGDRVIDLGPGEREHKRRLRTRLEPTYRLTYTPIDSWRSQAVRLSRWAKGRWDRRVAPVRVAR